jgi:hypothetical protein
VASSVRFAEEQSVVLSSACELGKSKDKLLGCDALADWRIFSIRWPCWPWFILLIRFEGLGEMMGFGAYSTSKGSTNAWVEQSVEESKLCFQ